jgi:PAS domain-containing protein
MTYSERFSIGSLRHANGPSAAEIRAERDLLVALVDRIPDGVIAVDEALTVQFVNPAAGALLGDLLPLSGRPLPERALGLSLRQFARAPLG